jgi:hypothetical protein
MVRNAELDRETIAGVTGPIATGDMLMTSHSKMIWERLRGRRTARLLAAAAITLSLFSLPDSSFAAEPLAAARPAELPEILANATVLSEAAMSKENATGLQPAQVLGQDTGRARVMLWDELKAPPELPPGTNGTVTLSIGGGK